MSWEEVASAIYGREVRGLDNPNNCLVPVKYITAYNFKNNTQTTIEINGFIVKPGESFWVLHREMTQLIGLEGYKDNNYKINFSSMVTLDMKNKNCRLPYKILRTKVTDHLEPISGFKSLFIDGILVEGRTNIEAINSKKIMSENIKVISKVQYKEKLLGYILEKQTRNGQGYLVYNKDNAIKLVRKYPEEGRIDCKIKSAYGNEYIESNCVSINIGNNLNELEKIDNDWIRQNLIRKITHDWRASGLVPSSYFKDK